MFLLSSISLDCQMAEDRWKTFQSDVSAYVPMNDVIHFIMLLKTVVCCCESHQCSLRLGFCVLW